MLPPYCYKFFLILLSFFPLVCLGEPEETVNKTYILKSINQNLSEKKLDQLIMFDKQLSFIAAFSNQNHAKGYVPNTLNIYNMLQNVLNRLETKLVIISQEIVGSQLSHNIEQKLFEFTIQEPTLQSDVIKHIKLSILIYTTKDDFLESYLLAERQFLFSLFPTPFPAPDVKNINNLGTAAAKIFPQEANNFVWTYKNIFCSIKNSNMFSFQLSVKIAQELQKELEKKLQL